ncbi:MAG: hypothetical protein WAW42_14890 [Candidatus Competibacteraceae bacterium]
MPQIAEHRLDRSEASPIAGFAFCAVDGPLQPLRVAFRPAYGFAPEEGDGSNPGLVSSGFQFIGLVSKPFPTGQP